MSLRAHFMARLARLVRLRLAFEGQLNELGDTFLRRAIEITYADCCAAGAGDEARALLATARMRR